MYYRCFVEHFYEQVRKLHSREEICVKRKTAATTFKKKNRWPPWILAIGSEIVLFASPISAVKRKRTSALFSDYTCRKTFFASKEFCCRIHRSWSLDCSQQYRTPTLWITEESQQCNIAFTCKLMHICVSLQMAWSVWEIKFVLGYRCGLRCWKIKFQQSLNYLSEHEKSELEVFRIERSVGCICSWFQQGRHW